MQTRSGSSTAWSPTRQTSQNRQTIISLQKKNTEFTIDHCNFKNILNLHHRSFARVLLVSGGIFFLLKGKLGNGLASPKIIGKNIQEKSNSRKQIFPKSFLFTAKIELSWMNLEAILQSKTAKKIPKRRCQVLPVNLYSRGLLLCILKFRK